jgi:C-terminal processing protease CtpA/Prc
MKTIFAITATALVLGTGARAVTNAVALAPSAEIIDLLRGHYVDREKLDQKLLNDATVGGILQKLGEGAKLLSPEQASSNALPVIESSVRVGEPVARAEVIEPDIGYLRIADVMGDTAMALDAELKKFSDKKVSAYVLDLRYADGTNFAAAADVASRFLPASEELFTLKQAGAEPKVFRSTEVARTLPPELAESPLMLLVNGETRGSAEVLVGALRAQDRGIVVGGATAGSAVAWEDIRLSDGRVLRLATSKISLPKGFSGRHRAGYFCEDQPAG